MNSSIFYGISNQTRIDSKYSNVKLCCSKEDDKDIIEDDDEINIDKELDDTEIYEDEYEHGNNVNNDSDNEYNHHNNDDSDDECHNSFNNIHFGLIHQISSNKFRQESYVKPLTLEPLHFNNGDNKRPSDKINDSINELKKECRRYLSTHNYELVELHIECLKKIIHKLI
jgi:hypothetical protein